MKRTVWKYTLEMINRQNLWLPEGAQILDAQTQGDNVCLWALVEPERRMETRTICILGTGHNATESDVLRHISSIQLISGTLVFHVFEVLNTLSLGKGAGQ